MANKHIERYLTPSINRKMQNKATMVYYFISIRIANIKYRKKTKELKGTHIWLVGMQHGKYTLENSLAVSYEDKHGHIIWSNNHTPAYWQEGKQQLYSSSLKSKNNPLAFQ